MIPSYPRRTSKVKILFRLSIVPIAVTLFWSFMLSLGGNYHIVRAALIGGFGATAAVFLFLWGFTNLMTALTMPKVWLLIKRSGGDPWLTVSHRLSTTTIPLCDTRSCIGRN